MPDHQPDDPSRDAEWCVGSFGGNPTNRLCHDAVMSTTVETALGPVAAAALGRVLSHEHIFVLSPEIQQNFPWEWGDEDRRVDDAVDRLNQLKAVGIDTIIDPTVLGLGRYVPRVIRVARRTDIHIVLATGLYTFDNLPMYFKARPPAAGVDTLTERFVADITDGIGGTTAKAGVLKCATDRPGLTRDVTRVLRAVARAHRTTGCPITTHTNAVSKSGLDQQRIFVEEGVDLSRVMIGHCGDTDDFDYLHALLDAGSWLGMDRFGLDGFISAEQRIDVVAHLCAEGYADRLMLSHDAGCYMDMVAGEGSPDPHGPNPNWHYLYISQQVVPKLRDRGVTDVQLDEMLVHAPRRFLESISRGGY